MKVPISSFLKSPIQKEDLELQDEEVVKVLRGKKGEKGDPGKDADVNEVAKKVIEPVTKKLKSDKEFIQKLKGDKGEPGESPKIDIVEITERVSALIPRTDEKKLLKTFLSKVPKNEPQELPELKVEEVIEKLHSSKLKIKNSHVEGFEEIESMVKNNSRQVKNFITSGPTTLKVKNNGQNLGGVETINFTNATIQSVGDGREINLTLSSSGLGRETPVGTIDGSNQTFTVSKIPDHINQDGMTYYEGYGYSRSNLTLTMTVPPTGFLISFY